MDSNHRIILSDKTSRLDLNSSKLVDDLINLGCIPRKTKKLQFPEIPIGLLSHFTRGYFDGDGSITFNRPNTIRIHILGTEAFLAQLRDLLTVISD